MKMYLIRFGYLTALLLISGFILTLLGLEITKIWWLYIILYITCDYFAKRLYLKNYGVELLALDFEGGNGDFECVVDYKNKRFLLSGFFTKGSINNTLLKSKLSSKFLKNQVNKEQLIKLFNDSINEVCINVNYEREVVPVILKLKSTLKK